MNKKYNKEDIESVFKTHFAEQSLIVMEMDHQQATEYIETALIKIEHRFLTKNDIEKWILSIPRFRDLFIYEKIEQPLRIRLKTIELPVTYVDAPNLSDAEILDWLDAQNLSFNIQQSPLFRIYVFNGNGYQYLACCYHHLLFDAISIQYALAALLAGTPVPTAEWIPKASVERIEKDHFKGFQLQNFVPSPIDKENDFLYENLELPDLSYKEIMAKWVEFLFLACGEEEVCIGEVFSLRNSEAAAQSALGYFVQTWPLIFKADADIKAALENQRATVLSHCEHAVGHYFQSGSFDHCWVVEPELKNEYKIIFRSKPHYLLSIVIQSAENGCSLSFVWNLNKIASEAAKEIVQSFSKFLNGNLNTPILGPANDALKPISEIWKENVSAQPDKIAVRDSKGNSFSYRQLDDLSDRLASKLDVTIQEPVGIRTSNSAMLIVAMLAILKKRAIYVPLDPEISNERLNYILNDAAIETVISDLDALPGKKMLHPLNENIENYSVPNLVAQLDDICYLIYTSGTTGQPKGCAVTQANLCNLFLGTLSDFDFNKDDRWIMAHSYGFDFSTWEIWGALLNAAFLYIPERIEVKDSFKLYDLLIREKISILNQTPKSFDNLMLVGESKPKLNNVRYLIFGGDKLNIKKVGPWLAENKQVTAVNMYGITETTVHVTFKKIAVEKYSNIGNPLAGYILSLRNKKATIVPDGFIGELYVAGAGVCRGYYGKESLTAEKFNFDKTPSYKSGDLGWRMSGDFYYLGRNDRQIKIRGYRIELGEIEFLLQKHFGQLFRVLFIDNSILIAFHTCATELERSMSKDLLPDYANPARFIRLESIPLNVNGKTDEKALENIFRLGQGASAKEEITILPYLIKLLGNNISTQKSFVENGGDSISAIRLVNALRKDGLNLSVQDLFAATSISAIKLQKPAAAITVADWRKDAQIELYNRENKPEIFGIFPLSEAQNGILYDSFAEDDNSYMVQLTYRVNAEISTESLKIAYLEVMHALPALQLQLTKIKDEFVWVLPKEPLFEIQNIAEADNFEQLLEADFKRPFDFGKNLIRLTIVEKQDGEKLLVWTHHHLLMDGWSLGLFSSMLFDALKGNILKKRAAYLDFLYGLKDHKTANDSYWQSRLKNFANEPLIPQLTIGQKLNDYEEIVLEVDEIALWKGISEQGLTQHNFVFSAWLAFVTAAFGKRELGLGNVVSLRDGNLEDEVGMLIQTLPFYVEVEPAEIFSNFTQKVKNQLISDNRHKDFAYSALDGIQLNLDHIFVFENYPIDASISENKEISIGKFNEKTAAKWTFICYPSEKGIKIRALVQTKFYNPDYSTEILNRFSEFIRNLQWDTAIESAKKSLTQWPIIHGKEKAFNISDNLFDQFCSKGDFKLIGNESILNREAIISEAESLATTLQQLGLDNNEAVGIDLQSLKHFATAVLAIWKLNAVPCSVDFRYPEQRKSFIWKNASCRFVLLDEGNRIQIEQLTHSKSEQPENASFILHTSGSTGVPKGVIQTKACLAHLADWTATELGLSSDEKILALSSFGFDASYHELILWLSLGATLVEMPYESRQDIQEIRNCILKQQISLAWIPARLLNAVLDSDPHYFDQCDSLKQLVTTGEALIIGDALKAWVERKNIRLFNFYGPTETHVVTAKIVDKKNISRIPDIGKPINNASIRLLDANAEAVPKGLIGEIWIGGPYLAQGYLNDEALSSQKFIEKDGQSWYKSGDSGWIDASGNIEYLGRLDDQIKIRGYRIEPFEVESLLHSLDGIEQAAIVVDKADEIRLIAFISGRKMADAEFRKACSKLMPDFMIPEILVFVEELPRNINGKIDRKLLLDTYKANSENSSGELPETRASKCWEAVLGHKNFGNKSQFQAVGGNSIKIMKLQAWIEKNYGIALSVKELIQHQRIETLDQLLFEKEKETIVLLPDNFPLNSLQRDMLIAETGNYPGGNSPFLLSFSCTLSFGFSPERFEKALEHIFAIYPHLGFVLSAADENGERHWKKCTNHRDYTQKPISHASLSNGEPLLRIFFEADKLTVQWHHILLDAVGISMVLTEFYKALQTDIGHTERNYQAFLSLTALKNSAKTESASKQAIIFEHWLSKVKKGQFERLATASSINLQDAFLLLSHSIFGRESCIAYTDNGFQCGIPGMFTFLNSSRLAAKGNIIESLQKNSGIDKTASMVTNFMYSPELPLDDLEIQSSSVQFCKYPYELQVELFEDKIKLQFIAEENNPLAEKKAKQLYENIEQVLKEQSFERLFSEKSKEIHFEDFDF